MRPLALLLLLLSLPDAPAQKLPDTQRLYCNFTVIYKVNPNSFFKKPFQATKDDLGTGSCWAANVSGQPVMVTAAHNIARGPNFIPQSLIPQSTERPELISLEIMPIIGLLGYEIQAVGFPNGNPDWVALRPKDARAFKSSQLKELSKTAPKVGDSLVVIGFPDTAHEQRTDRTITSLSPNGDFIVFNQPLDPGYSGGVVLNAKSQAVGVVVTTEIKQSTALLLTLDQFKGLEWKPIQEVQTQNFQ